MFDTGSYFSLEGQTAIVTGGTTGLGLAITRCMVGAGAKVAVLSYESREQGREALKEFGGKAVFYQFDITDTDHTQEMADRVIAEQGPVTILVNNAGNHCKKYIEDMTVEDYVNVLNVHLVGAFALTKALFPHMKEQGKGSILFQASMTSYIGQPQVAGYATAKAGYLGLVHTLQQKAVLTECASTPLRRDGLIRPCSIRLRTGDQVRLGKILGTDSHAEGGKRDGYRYGCRIFKQ